MHKSAVNCQNCFVEYAYIDDLGKSIIGNQFII